TSSWRGVTGEPVDCRRSCAARCARPARLPARPRAVRRCPRRARARGDDRRGRADDPRAVVLASVVLRRAAGACAAVAAWRAADRRDHARARPAARRRDCARDQARGEALTGLEAVTIALVALGGAATVLTREPFRQAMVSGLFGLLLVVLFLIYQAPDVAVS